MEDVGVRFSGSSAGAVGAARKTSVAIEEVKRSASGSSAPLRGMEKDLGRVERGALAGSGAFKGLGRSVAFASGAFLGAAGFVEVVKHSIDVTLAAQTSIARLDKAVQNAHASVKAMTPILEAHAAAARKLGFDDNDTRDAEAKLVTAFGATKKALDELRAAEDLARATNTDLGTATRQLILLQEGNARAAKQFGLTLPDLTAKQWAAKAATDGLNVAQEKGKTLYDELLPRIKDQSAAYANSPAGKIAEFHAQITHLEESIGTGLLPVVDKYLTEVDDWLAKGSNQRKVTNDVRKVVDELAAVLGDAKRATEKFLEFANPVVKTLGGWKTIIEILIGLKFASVIAGWTTEMQKSNVQALLLNKRLGILQGLMAKPFQFIIAYEIIKKVTGSNADLSNDAGSDGTLLPHYENGKWVDPVTGQPVQDQGYWNRYYKKQGNPGKPMEGQTAGGADAGSAKQQALVRTARKFGPGSGGLYQTGGVGGQFSGPGGSVVTYFDCSGYLYDIYKRNGITIPRTSEAQWADPNAIRVPKGAEQPGDGVYFTGSAEYAPPGHCGIYIGNGRFIEYYSSGKPARFANLADRSDYWGARRWVKVKQSGSGDGGKTSPYGPDQSKPPAGGGGTKAPAKTKFVGEHPSAIVSAQGSAAALLRGLPDTLDPVERNAVAHIKAIQDSLHVHMPAAELAKDRVELTRWGKVLHDEIGKQAKIVAAAAAEATKKYDQALSLDVSHVLRDFDEGFQRQIHTFDTETSRHLRDLQTGFSRQMQTFDRETQKGLQGLVVAQTPEEKAYADFLAKRAGDDLAKSRADQLANASTDDERAQLALGFSLDDQEQALKDAADQSRVAQDAKTSADQQAYQDQRDLLKQSLQDKETDLEQAYQDERDAQKQALQDINDDQRTALQQNLDDWVSNLEAKKKSWTEFLTWLAQNGFDTSGLPNPGASGSGSGNAGQGARRIIGAGVAIPFATGGRVPGRYVGRDDTVLARLTPGETVLSRELTGALERMAAGGALQVVAGDVYLDTRKVGTHVARPVTDAQDRQIGYTSQRG